MEVLLQLPQPLSCVKQTSSAWSVIGNNGDFFVSNWREVLFAIVSVQHSTGRQAGISVHDRNSVERFLLWAEKSQLLNTNLWGLLARDLGDSFFSLLVIQSGGLYGSSEALYKPLPSAATEPDNLSIVEDLLNANNLCTPHYTAPLCSVLPQLWKWHKSSSNVLQTTLQHVALDTPITFSPTF